MIVAFTGGMGVGKSTAINQLNQLINGKTLNIKFAQPLYDMQEMIYGLISGVHAPPEGFVKDRKLLQWLGTDWGRDTISESLWVDLWKQEVKRKEFMENPKAITCDDCRFPNEADAVHAEGGFVIKIIRSSANPEGGTGIAAHKSEVGLNEKYVDFVIVNDNTVESLRNQLKGILELIQTANNERRK